MSPQNGHIRWDAKSPTCASIPIDFLSEAAMKARRLRTPTMIRCKTLSIVTSRFSESLPNQAQHQVVAKSSSDNNQRLSGNRTITLLNLTSHDDTSILAILCKSARLVGKCIRRSHSPHG